VKADGVMVSTSRWGDRVARRRARAYFPATSRAAQPHEQGVDARIKDLPDSSLRRVRRPPSRCVGPAA